MKRTLLPAAAMAFGTALGLLADDELWIPEGLAGRNVRMLASSGEPGGPIYAATDLGLFRNTDGVWAPIAETFAPTSLAVEPGNSRVVWAIGSDGLYKSTDGGDHFALIPGLLSRAAGPLAIDPVGNPTVYVGGEPSTLEGVEGWRYYSVGRAASLAVDPYRSAVYAGGERVDQPPDTDPDGPGDPGDPDPCDSCGPWDYVRVGSSDAVLLSGDGGASWRSVLRRDRRNTYWIVQVWALAVADANGMIFAGTEDATGASVFRSDDTGSHWSRTILTHRPGDGVRALAIDPRSPTTLYAGTRYSGIFVSGDLGASWRPINAGLGSFPITSLHLDLGEGLLRAGTTDGIYVLRPKRAPSACRSSAERACLLRGRFQVELTATRVQNGRTAEGVVVRAADRHAVFSLPALLGDATFPEVAIKMLYPFGRAVWVFHGSLTSAAYEVKITDTYTGKVDSLRNDPNRPFCGGAVFDGFGADVADAEGGAPALSPAKAGSVENGLSLLSGRFTVTLSAQAPPDGHAVSGTAVPGNDRWGYFSVPGVNGDPTLPEVLVKMADFRPFIGRFLVFHASVGLLEYTLTVTDNVTGAVRTFESQRSHCGGAHADSFQD